MARKNILYIGGFELPDKNAAAHRVIANAKILRDLGYHVTLVGVDKRQTLGSGVVRMKEDYFGFECWSMAYPEGIKAWVLYILGLSELLQFVRARLAQGFALIAYNFPAIAQYRVFRLCKKSFVLRIPDVTEWYDSAGGALTYRIVKWIDTALRMYVINRYSSGLITTSHFVSEFYRTKGHEVVEIPTLFTTSDFCEPPVTDGAVKKFVYVGSPFDPARVNRSRTNLKERLDLMVEAFYQLKGSTTRFQFDVYGIDCRSYLSVFPEHKEMLSEMAGIIAFHGYEDNEKVRLIIAQSDFTIFVRDETRVTLAGFPSKFSESVSMGTPVIANRMASLSCYRNYDFAYVYEGALVDCLAECLRIDEAAIKSLKLKAFRSNLFDYKSYTAEVDDFLKKIVSNDAMAGASF